MKPVRVLDYENLVLPIKSDYFRHYCAICKEPMRPIYVCGDLVNNYPAYNCPLCGNKFVTTMRRVFIRTMDIYSDVSYDEVLEVYLRED